MPSYSLGDIDSAHHSYTFSLLFSSTPHHTTPAFFLSHSSLLLPFIYNYKQIKTCCLGNVYHQLFFQHFFYCNFFLVIMPFICEDKIVFSILVACYSFWACFFFIPKRTVVICKVTWFLWEIFWFINDNTGLQNHNFFWSLPILYKVNTDYSLEEGLPNNVCTWPGIWTPDLLIINWAW